MPDNKTFVCVNLIDIRSPEDILETYDSAVVPRPGDRVHFIRTIEATYEERWSDGPLKFTGVVERVEFAHERRYGHTVRNYSWAHVFLKEVSVANGE